MKESIGFSTLFEDPVSFELMVFFFLHMFTLRKML